MATIANPPTYRNVFFAHLDGLSGTLAQLDDGQVYCFHPDSGGLVPISGYKGLTVLGECGVANAQMILDEMRGGYAHIATSRLQEVA